MKYRVSFLVAAAAALIASSAMAAPVFMLQFGSFETREEAEKRLSELKTKHAGVIGNMQSGIREVSLPPDNLTVYRTQAGPLDTRADAQSVCSQLASNGDECYVVETAMMAPMSPPTTQVAQADTAAAAAPTPAPTPIAEPASIPQSASSGSTIPPQPDVAPPVAITPIPARDPDNMAAIARVSAPADADSRNAQLLGRPPMQDAMDEAAAQQEAAMSKASTSPEMQQAMDDAAAQQNTELAAAPTPPGAKKEGTFWSRLNPFSDDEDDAPAPVAKAEEKPSDVDEAVPVEQVASASTMPAPAPLPEPTPIVQAEPTPIVQAEPTPIVTPAPVVVTAPVIVPANTPAPLPAPTAAAAPIVIADAMPAPLPPPPPPTNPADRAAFESGRVPPSAGTAPMPVIPPEPTGTIEPAPMPIVAAPPLITPAPNANVRVGEAQRVPLSQVTVPPPPVTMAPPPAVPSAALMPSSTLGQKTLWAQVSAFDDTQAALAYWDNYRRTHPDFPVVRVRVTTPYQAITRGYNKVSLRVGPFAKAQSITNLCQTMQDDHLRCGQVTDLGIAAGIGGPRNGYLPGSRYHR